MRSVRQTLKDMHLTAHKEKYQTCRHFARVSQGQARVTRSGSLVSRSSFTERACKRLLTGLSETCRHFAQVCKVRHVFTRAGLHLWLQSSIYTRHACDCSQDCQAARRHMRISRSTSVQIIHRSRFSDGHGTCSDAPVSLTSDDMLIFGQAGTSPLSHWLVQGWLFCAASVWSQTGLFTSPPKGSLPPLGR